MDFLLNRIREKREAMGLSQTTLACRIGVAASTLSDLELGKRQPWPKVRRALAEMLKTTPEELFSGN